MNSSLLKSRDKLFEMNRPWIMGIVNLSPESFYTNHSSSKTKDLFSLIDQMIEHGVDIIDLGAASTKPGLPKISSIEEKNRLIPVLKSLRKNFKDTLFSVDSSCDQIICEAIDEGVDIVNDVSGGNLKESTFEKIAQHAIPYILTFNSNGEINEPVENQSTSIVNEAIFFLSKKIHQLNKMGCKDIIIDLGFGFNKALNDNFMLCNRIKDFTMFKKPILIGVSRKSMLYKALQTEPENTLNATTVIHTISILNGGSILRVHDIKEANEVRKLIGLMQSNREN